MQRNPNMQMKNNNDTRKENSDDLTRLQQLGFFQPLRRPERQNGRPDIHVIPPPHR
jgi:hypothetical protein